MAKKVALITGGNAGIGLAVARRLLNWDPKIEICLACRNKAKAQDALESLKADHPSAEIMVVLTDISNLHSVYQAAKAVKEKYSHLDYVFLNAGIMPVSRVDWGQFWTGIFSPRCVHMLRTGEGLLKQVDRSTPEGLRLIFATNLFGHFVLVRELEDILGGHRGSSQVIWTSSSNADKSAFTPSDIQHRHGYEPYSSSKYASDIISVAMNDRLNYRGIYSHTTCPGLVMTNLTFGILPSWFWLLMLPLILLLRIAVQSMTYSAHNGAEALVWLTKQSPQALDPMSKFHSRTSFLGRNYVETKKINTSLDAANSAYDELSKMERVMRSKFKS